MEFESSAHDPALEVPEERLKLCELGRLRKERFQAFKEQIIRIRIPLGDSAYLQELDVKVKRAVDAIIDEYVRVMQKYYLVALLTCNVC